MTSAYAIGFENYVPGDGGIAESMNSAYSICFENYFPGDGGGEKHDQKGGSIF